MEDLTPRAQAKADQIRKAARKLFLAYGASATSMDAITAEAGVSKQTVYAYFPSKEALLSDVVSGLVSAHAQQWEDYDPAGVELDSWESLEAELVTLSNRVLGLMEPNFLETLRLLATEAGSNPHYGKVFRESLADPIMRAFNAILRKAAADGLLPAPPHADIARLLAGPLLSFVFVEGLFRPDDVRKPSPRRTRRLVGQVVAGLQASARTPVHS